MLSCQPGQRTGQTSPDFRIHPTAPDMKQAQQKSCGLEDVEIAFTCLSFFLPVNLSSASSVPCEALVCMWLVCKLPGEVGQGGVLLEYCVV